MKKGTFYIVATPIGNMGDISKRAVEILSTVDFVVCEDTRVAGGLLHLLKIKKELVSIHQHSSQDKIAFVVRELQEGKSAAYVSDCGTPAISDPGQVLVRKLRESGIEVLPIPGASALTAAISVSGMVNKEFYFAGFLPKKKGRETKMKMLATLDCSIVIYESAQRVEKTLNDLRKYFGEDLEVFVAREMTKKFEEYWNGKIDEIISTLNAHTIKGEFVLIVSNQ